MAAPLARSQQSSSIISESVRAARTKGKAAMSNSPVVADRLRLKQAEELQYYLLKQIEHDQSADLLEELHCINKEIESLREKMPLSPSVLPAHSKPTPVQSKAKAARSPAKKKSTPVKSKPKVMAVDSPMRTESEVAFVSAMQDLGTPGPNKLSPRTAR